MPDIVMLLLIALYALYFFVVLWLTALYCLIVWLIALYSVTALLIAWLIALYRGCRPGTLPGRWPPAIVSRGRFGRGI